MGRCRQSTGAGFQCVYVCVWWRGAETGEDFPVYSKPTENALLPVEVSVGSLWFLKGKERKKERAGIKACRKILFFFFLNSVLNLLQYCFDSMPLFPSWRACTRGPSSPTMDWTRKVPTTGSQGKSSKCFLGGGQMRGEALHGIQGV